MTDQARLEGFLQVDQPVVRIHLAKVRGSSPREAGTEMFVSPDAVCGTIGGGQLEHRAIAAARQMLETGQGALQLDLPLGPEIGQCCGGWVSARLVMMTGADRAEAIARGKAEAGLQPHVYILGAGHVGRAMADLFQHMPCNPVLVDSRATELAHCHAAVEKRLSALPEHDIQTAPPGSAFVVLTHDHGLDFLLTSAALARGDATYVGLIGSATKRVRFERWHAKHGATDIGVETLICPIGAGGSRDKRPAVIAAAVVAEVIAALTSEPAATAPYGAAGSPLAAQ